MFTLTKPPIEAGNNLTHFATSRQVATDSSFDAGALLINDIKNTIELLSVDIDLPLSVDDKYFVRDKLHFRDGNNVEVETSWSRPIIVTKNMDGFTISNTIIGTPKLNVNFNKNDAPLGGFSINATDYILFNGVGEHEYTEWIIEDLFGNVKWKKENDGYNLTSIKVPDCLLDKNKTYIIKCRYISTTNMYSNYGKLIICTNNYYMDTSCSDVNDDTVGAGAILEMLVATTIYNTI